MEQIDKVQLGQLIRMKSHFIDMYMKCDGREKELEELFNQLTCYVDEWNDRGLELGMDKLWANEILAKYKRWVNEKKKLINQSSIDYINNDIIHLIKDRRSIRFWKKQLVSHEILNGIIEAGTFAPSSFNRMTWKFYVVENNIENIVEGDSSNRSMIEKAPVRIYIAIDERLYEEEYAPAMDAALAAQNMLLASHLLGLGACLLYQCEIINQDMIREKLKIPEYYGIYCAILLGYPDEYPAVPGRVNIEEVTEFFQIENSLETFLK